MGSRASAFFPVDDPFVALYPRAKWTKPNVFFFLLVTGLKAIGGNSSIYLSHKGQIGSVYLAKRTVKDKKGVALNRSHKMNIGVSVLIRELSLSIVLTVGIVPWVTIGNE